MENKFKEIVKVYADCLNDEGKGNFVRCSACEELQLIQIGGTSCGECESENLEWYVDANGNEIQEVTASKLEEMGFILEYM